MNPRDAGAYLNLGKVCRSERRFPEAEAALRKALGIDPQNEGARLELGILYMEQERFSDAAAEFEKAITKNQNNNSWAYCQLGRIYRRQGRLSDSEVALHKALELDPRDGWAQFELGVLCQGQDRFLEAVEAFKKAITIDQNNGLAHCQLGSIYRGQGQFSESEAALNKALEITPQNVGARMELGALYLEQDRLSEAEGEFEKVIAMDRSNSGAHCQLGRIYHKQGQWPKAEEVLRKALELDPQNGCVRIALGVLYEDQSKFMQAEAEFEKSVATTPDNVRALRQLGRFYRRQSRPSEAEVAFNKALKIDPHNVDTCMELADLCRDQERFSEAETACWKAIAIDPHNVCAHLCLGNIHLRQGHRAEGEAEFQRVVALAPRNDGAYIGLWAVYRGQGRSAEAEAALAKALAISPKSSFACTEWLDRLDRDRAVGYSAKEPTQERVFCLLPWTNLHIRADGLFRPCCAWSGPPLGNARSSSLAELWNSPSMKALRLNMMKGRPVAGCWRCYGDERSGLCSTRQRSNIELGRHRGRARLTAPDGTLPRLPVPLLDIRFSNVCNLRCRTCDTMQSSAWAADARALGLPNEGCIRKSYDDWDALWRQLQPLLEEGPEEILFVGGEPLIMEEHYRILDFLLARGLTDVRLTYMSNFSTLRFQGRDVLDLWSRFRNVRIAASLDGSSRRGEYLRKGLCWEAVEANREELLRRCPNVAFTISATLSIFNALHLPDFHREWVAKGYIGRDEFALNMLVSPAMYSVQVLPPALKSRVLASFRGHQELFLDADGAAARDFAAAARFMAAQDRSELLPGFVAMTRRLDRLRGEDCREVFPELAELFETAA